MIESKGKFRCASEKARHSDNLPHTGNLDRLYQRDDSDKMYTDGLSNDFKAEGYCDFRSNRQKNNNDKWGLGSQNDNNLPPDNQKTQIERFSESNIVFIGQGFFDYLKDVRRKIFFPDSAEFDAAVLQAPLNIKNDVQIFRWTGSKSYDIEAINLTKSPGLNKRDFDAGMFKVSSVQNYNIDDIKPNLYTFWGLAILTFVVFVFDMYILASKDKATRIGVTITLQIMLLQIIFFGVWKEQKFNRKKLHKRNDDICKILENWNKEIGNHSGVSLSLGNLGAFIVLKQDKVNNQNTLFSI